MSRLHERTKLLDRVGVFPRLRAAELEAHTSCNGPYDGVRRRRLVTGVFVVDGDRRAPLPIVEGLRREARSANERRACAARLPSMVLRQAT